MASSNPYRYAGYRYDESTGMYYLMARYYDPSIGRFITEDTYKGHGDAPLSLNGYTYVHNNPVNNIDSTGNWCESYIGKHLMYAHPGHCTNKKNNHNETPDAAHNGSWIVNKGKPYQRYWLNRDTVHEDFGFEMDLMMALTPRGGQVSTVAKAIKIWLGPGAKWIVNKAGDKVFMSKDGTKRVRFDIKNPSPHQSPHGHIEELINGKWVKSGQIYPKDVPHK